MSRGVAKVDRLELQQALQRRGDQANAAAAAASTQQSRLALVDRALSFLEQGQQVPDQRRSLSLASQLAFRCLVKFSPSMLQCGSGVELRTFDAADRRSIRCAQWNWKLSRTCSCGMSTPRTSERPKRASSATMTPVSALSFHRALQPTSQPKATL